MTIPTAQPLTPTAKCGLCNRDLYSWMHSGDCRNEPLPITCPLRDLSWEDNLRSAFAPTPPLDYLKIENCTSTEMSLEEQQKFLNDRRDPHPYGLGPSPGALIAVAALLVVVGTITFFAFWLFT